MKILLISDAHANIEALNEVVNHTDFDEAVFMGDVVDYGPNPMEVFDLLRHIVNVEDTQSVSGSRAPEASDLSDLNNC